MAYEYQHFDLGGGERSYGIFIGGLDASDSLFDEQIAWHKLHAESLDPCHCGDSYLAIIGNFLVSCPSGPTQSKLSPRFEYLGLLRQQAGKAKRSAATRVSNDCKQESI